MLLKHVFGLAWYCSFAHATSVNSPRDYLDDFKGLVLVISLYYLFVSNLV